MGVTKPKSGDVITTSSITDMYDAVKTVVNTVPTGSIDDSCFGIQHLPSCIPHADGTTTVGAASVSLLSTASEVVIDTATYQMVSETEADVVTSSTWGEILDLTTSGGWELPPCKVLVMFDASVSDITKSATAGRNTGLGWMSVYYVANYGASDVVEWEARNMAVITGYQDAIADSTTVTDHTANECISIWFIIDKTSLVANWTLKNIFARGAVGTGNQTAIKKPVNMKVTNANLSFVALYKDS